MGRAILPLNEPEREARGRKIVRGIGSLSVQGLLSGILGFVLLSSVLRLLPSVSYDAYSSVQICIGVASVFTVFGLNSSVVRFLNPSLDKEGRTGWDAAKASVTLAIIFSGVVSLAMVVGAPFISIYFLKTSEWSWVYWIGSLWLFADSVSTILSSFLQGLRRYNLLARALLTSKLVATSLAVMGLVEYGSLLVVLISWIAYYVLTASVVLHYVWQPLKMASARTHFRAVLGYASPLGLAGAVATITSSSDLIIVGGYLDPGSLGVYNATIGIASILSVLFVIPLVTALFAESSFSSETHSEITKGVSLALRFVMLIVLPASLFATAVAPQFFFLVSGGGAFGSGILYLEVITMFYLFLAIQTAGTYILQGVGKTRLVLITGLITASSGIGLSLLLIPTFGLGGAVISRVTTFVLGSCVSVFFLRSYLDEGTSLSFIAKALVSGGVPAMLIFILSSGLSDRVLTLLPYAVLDLVFYLGCAKALNLFSAEDKTFLSHLLPTELHWVVERL